MCCRVVKKLCVCVPNVCKLTKPKPTMIGREIRTQREQRNCNGTNWATQFWPDVIIEPLAKWDHQLTLFWISRTEIKCYISTRKRRQRNRINRNKHTNNTLYMLERHIQYHTPGLITLALSSHNQQQAHFFSVLF